ncbi:MAG: hypothetical protein Q9177_001565 [Variospora cf. flavescens]
MLPLCLRALAAPYESTSFILTAVYAVFVSLCYFLSSFNHRWAYGPPRTVELLNEVAVVTGGASGLGRCIVEIYAMKGVSVAAIDIDVKEEGEREGVWWYQCDVGDQMMVEKTWSRINRDASAIAFHISLAAELRSTSNLKMLLVTPGQLDTAMFSYVKLGWIRNFFGPVLEVRELAIKIVNTINAGEGGTIALPAYARWISWLQILPKAIQDSLKRSTGVDTAMMDGPVEQSSSKTEVKNSPSGTQSESESD